MRTPEDEARARLLEIKKGSHVVVVSGRKVKKGTTGVVFWVGPGTYGNRVGFKAESGDAFWIAQSNCQAFLPGLEPDEDPDGGWVQLEEKWALVLQKWEAQLPKIRDEVKIKTSGIQGKVFWVKDGRLGFKTSTGETHWTGVSDVVRVLEDGTEVEVRGIPVFPRLYREGETPRHFERLGKFPPPICHICSLEKKADAWNAYDKDGVLVMQLTERSAQQILDVIEDSI